MIDKKIRIIYLLGGGHSGSTLLSMILGTSAQVFNAGELKFYSKHKQQDFTRWQEIENVCMCGEDAMACPFWQEVESLAPKLDAFYSPGIMGYFKILLHKAGMLPRPQTEDVQILNNTFTCAQRRHPEVSHILDMSKSLARLDHLLSTELIEIYTIFLIRDPRGYVNSYRKRYGKGFFRWIGQWLLLNYMSKVYLELAAIRHLTISYERLVFSPNQELARIEDFLAITLPENYLDEVNRQDLHIRAGNPALIQKRVLSELSQDDSWKTELSQFQSWLIRLMTFPLKYIHDR